jgi:uncharacterized membrane protein (DUF106 family)
MSAIDISIMPVSTIIVLLITVAVSLINMTINRLLISRMVGWEDYKTMRTEIAEHNAQKMQALRANDKKMIEKLKKKDAQIQRMQMKMSKPQLLLFPIGFVYLIIWYLFLIPAYGANAVAFVPGIGGIPVFYWYLICSFAFGTLISKFIGITPIE